MGLVRPLSLTHTHRPPFISPGAFGPLLSRPLFSLLFVCWILASRNPADAFRPEALSFSIPSNPHPVLTSIPADAVTSLYTSLHTYTIISLRLYIFVCLFIISFYIRLLGKDLDYIIQHPTSHLLQSWVPFFFFTKKKKRS